MKTRIQLRWWLCALATAGALLLSFEVLDEARTQEVTVATADTECFVATDLARSRQAAEARAEEQLLARDSEKLMAMQRARDEALDRAAPILGNADL